MRFTISREKLQEGLAAVTAAVPAKTTLPVLANLLIETTDRGIRLSATDLDIAVSTAMAGEMLGLKTLYLEAGSGAINPVSEQMIAGVSTAVSVPVMVGGGIRTPEKAAAGFRAGADLIVVGNALEADPGLVRELAAARLSA